MCRNVAVLEWRCVRMALCRNGIMPGNVVVNDKMSGDEHSVDPLHCPDI